MLHAAGQQTSQVLLNSGRVGRGGGLLRFCSGQHQHKLALWLAFLPKGADFRQSAPVNLLKLFG